MHSPSRPASRKISKRSWGYSPVSSISRARGFTLSWARRRTVVCSPASSSDSSQSMPENVSRRPPHAEMTPPRASPTQPVSGLGGLAPLADDAPALALGRSAPHAVSLTVGQGVLQARLAHGALGADGLGFVGVFFGD